MVIHYIVMHKLNACLFKLLECCAVVKGVAAHYRSRKLWFSHSFYLGKCRAKEGGELSEGGFFYFGLCARVVAMGEDIVGDLFNVLVLRRKSAAEKYAIGGEQVDYGHQPTSQRFCGVVDNCRRFFVAAFRRKEEVGGFFALAEKLLGAYVKAKACRIFFKAAFFAATAGAAVFHYGKMPKLACAAKCAAEDFAVKDDARADACAEGDADYRAFALAAAKKVLAPGCGSRILNHAHGDSQLAFKLGNKAVARKGEVGRFKHTSAVFAYRSRHACAA